ncbi:MAG: bifunctional metallophosphatase/5'-nucleotidase [Firmicutes bacterium]|nr:bifunctional metallophosphatase/5'-nucleotidase [Bacillota bacterium]
MKVTLDFLCHADFSGRLRKSKTTPGLSAFSATVESVRELNPEGTLLLDAGDHFSVNLWGGLPVVKAVNMMGTDAMTLGNHEFDRGSAFLEECIAACDFPVLCANIHYKDGKPIKGTVPYTILERQGVKIGVLGLVTEYTPFMVEKSAFEPFSVSSSIEAARRYIPEMRKQGAEVVVALTHFPFYIEEDGTISGELWDVLSNIPPVDICIGGHIPGDYAEVLNGTCVIKAGFAGESLGHVQLVFDTETRKIVDKKCGILLTDWDQEGRADVAAYARSVTDPFEDYFNEPLAHAEETWVMKLARETKLGDFLADCMRFGGQTELAYMNATSATGSIEPGVVTRETITLVSGYNDPVCVGEITGRQLYQLMEMVYEPERFGNNAAILISGFHAELDHTKPSPNKVVRLSLPDGTPIDPDRSYSVATSAYMASGGNGTAELAEQIAFRKLDLRFHDAIFAYCKSLGNLRVEDYPRFKEIGTPENDNSPF